MTCKLLCDAGCFLAGQLIHLTRLDSCALPSPEQCPPLGYPPRSGYNLKCLHVALALVKVACDMSNLQVVAFLRNKDAQTVDADIMDDMLCCHCQLVACGILCRAVPDCHSSLTPLHASVMLNLIVMLSMCLAGDMWSEQPHLVCAKYYSCFCKWCCHLYLFQPFTALPICIAACMIQDEKHCGLQPQTHPVTWHKAQ